MMNTLSTLDRDLEKQDDALTSQNSGERNNDPRAARAQRESLLKAFDDKNWAVNYSSYYKLHRQWRADVRKLRDAESKLRQRGQCAIDNLNNKAHKRNALESGPNVDDMTRYKKCQKSTYIADLRQYKDNKKSLLEKLESLATSTDCDILNNYGLNIREMGIEELHQEKNKIDTRTLEELNNENAERAKNREAKEKLSAPRSSEADHGDDDSPTPQSFVNIAGELSQSDQKLRELQNTFKELSNAAACLKAAIQVRSFVSETEKWIERITRIVDSKDHAEALSANLQSLFEKHVGTLGSIVKAHFHKTLVSLSKRSDLYDENKIEIITNKLKKRRVLLESALSGTELIVQGIQQPTPVLENNQGKEPPGNSNRHYDETIGQTLPAKNLETKFLENLTSITSTSFEDPSTTIALKEILDFLATAKHAPRKLTQKLEKTLDSYYDTTDELGIDATLNNACNIITQLSNAYRNQKNVFRTKIIPGVGAMVTEVFKGPFQESA